MARQGLVDASEIARAMQEAVPERRKAMPLLAAHAAQDAVRADPEAEVHRLTIDARLQKRLEALARERAQALGPNMSAALIVVRRALGSPWGLLDLLALGWLAVPVVWGFGAQLSNPAHRYTRVIEALALTSAERRRGLLGREGIEGALLLTPASAVTSSTTATRRTSVSTWAMAAC